MKCYLTLRNDCVPTPLTQLPEVSGFYELKLKGHRYCKTTQNLREALMREFRQLIHSKHQDTRLQSLYRADSIIEVDYHCSAHVH